MISLDSDGVDREQIMLALRNAREIGQYFQIYFLSSYVFNELLAFVRSSDLVEGIFSRHLIGRDIDGIFENY